MVKALENGWARLGLAMTLGLVAALALVASAGAAEHPDPIGSFGDAITDLIADIIPVAIAVIVAALGVAGGILVARVGFRWVRSFVK